MRLTPRGHPAPRVACLAAGALLFGTLASSVSARESQPAARSSAAFAAGEVEWRPEFRRVGWPEYVAAPLLLTGAFVQSYFFEPETDADWTGPILLDRSFQNLLRAA